MVDDRLSTFTGCDERLIGSERRCVFGNRLGLTGTSCLVSILPCSLILAIICSRGEREEVSVCLDELSRREVVRSSVRPRSVRVLDPEGGRDDDVPVRRPLEVPEMSRGRFSEPTRTSDE